MSETPQGTWLGGARKVASGSIAQGFWLRDRKVGSQVISEDRSRPWERNSWGSYGRKKKGQRQDERESTQIQVKFGLEKGASSLPCLSLGDDSEARREAEM